MPQRQNAGAVQSDNRKRISSGFDTDEALLAVASLESYTLGFTVQQRVRAGRDAGYTHPPLFDLPRDQFPNLSQAPEKYAHWANEERFLSGLAWAINNLRRDRDNHHRTT
jgi:hypothetical protein